jgi:hypothetical protein
MTEERKPQPDEAQNTAIPSPQKPDVAGQTARAPGSERVLPAPELTPYDLAPVEEPLARPVSGSDSSRHDPAEPAPWTRDAVSSRPLKSGASGGRVGSGRFIDDLPDDADLSDLGSAPGVVTPKGGVLEGSKAGDAVVSGVFVKEGMGNQQLIAGIALGVTLIGCVLAGINASSEQGAWWAGSVLHLFFTLVFSACGFVAVGLAAHLSGLAIGNLALGAVRMSLLAALAMTLGAVRIPALGLFAGLVIIAMVVGGYWLAASILFRQGPRRTMAMAASHFAISIGLWLVLQTYALVQSATVAPVAK